MITKSALFFLFSLLFCLTSCSGRRQSLQALKNAFNLPTLVTTVNDLGVSLVSLTPIMPDHFFLTLPLESLIILNRPFPIRAKISKFIEKFDKVHASLFLDALCLSYYISPVTQASDLTSTHYIPLNDINRLFLISLPEKENNFLSFSTNERKLLKLMFPNSSVDNITNTFDVLFNKLHQFLLNQQLNIRQHLQKVFTKESFWRSLSIVLSRSVEVAGTDLNLPVSAVRVLYPILDLINHCYSEEEPFTVEKAFKTVDGMVSFSVKKYFTAGEEICYSYPQLDNLNLLLTYGFSAKNNRNDRVEIEVNVVEDQEIEAVIKENKIVKRGNVVKMPFYKHNYEKTFSVLTHLLKRSNFTTNIFILQSFLKEVVKYEPALHLSLEQVVKNNGSNVEKHIMLAKNEKMKIWLYQIECASQELENVLDDELKSAIK